MEKWRTTAQYTQQEFAICMGDRKWEKYSIPEHDEYLWKKIAFAIAGPPSSTNRTENYGYTKDQVEGISEIKGKCIEYCKKQGWKDVYIAMIFVCAYNSEGQQRVAPLIRLKRGDGIKTGLSYFIDHYGRVYEGYENFLANNMFNGWWICVPKNAEYTFSNENSVEIEFYNQSERGNVLQALDKVSTVANVTTSVALAAGVVMSVIPFTAPVGWWIVAGSSIAGAPGALYVTGRSVGTLIDRGAHDQSINPFVSADARCCWLTTVATALSIGAMASAKILTSTAKAGELASSGTRAFCSALNVTALSTSGMGVVNAFDRVIKKLKKNEEVSPLEVFLLTTSLFFFTHSLITSNTASTIINEAQHDELASTIDKETQHDELASIRSALNTEEQAVFDQIYHPRQEMVDPAKIREIRDNKEFIRDLKIIENKQEFLSAFRLVEGNQVNVKEEVVIDSEAFLQMSEEKQNQLLEIFEDLRNNKIDEAEFNRIYSAIGQEYRITHESQQHFATNQLQELFGVWHLSQVNLDGKNIFENLKPHELDRLHQVMAQAGKNYHPDRFRVAMEMARKSGCSNATEFTDAAEYAFRQMDSAVSSRMQNPNPTRPEGMKPEDFYAILVADEFISNLQTSDATVNSFKNFMKDCKTFNTGNPRFGNSMAAANHYDKHPHFPEMNPNNNMSPEQYIKIATHLSSGPMVNPTWTQYGYTLVCNFTSEKHGAVAVRFFNLANKKSVIATLMNADLLKPIGFSHIISTEDLRDGLNE
ncbi:uncharacterized protein LOC130690848 [Daphnia carinata]|uniref:uncharacterized protein LOC130690848 n=1 Tax=Daphnia carinata TaxID=120202 RepID=UPI00257AFD01|nr:uncharacterized protein LOC130690848 [Daphnia carinata]